MTKLEAQVAELQEEVRQLTRSRGSGLPDLREVAHVALLLCRTSADFDPTQERLRALDAGDPQPFLAHVGGLEVTPACEPVRDSLVAALAAVLADDMEGYKEAIAALKSAVLRLLLLRAPGWEFRWFTTVGMTPAVTKVWLAMKEASPEAMIGEALARVRGGGLLTVAARCCRCAADELPEWQAWHAGGEGQKWHRFWSRERLGLNGGFTSGDPASYWARDVAQHLLPDEEEAALIERGLAIQEQVDAVQALPPISPGRIADSR
jgi:hypothetical protein